MAGSPSPRLRHRRRSGTRAARSCGSWTRRQPARRSGSSALQTRRLVLVGLEPDQQAAAAEVEHRPLDHRRLRQHQRNRLLLVDRLFVLVGQLAEGRAGAVEQRVPADLLAPPLQPLAVDAIGLVVVEGVGDALLVEPGARFLHRAAVLDALDRDAHSAPLTPSEQVSYGAGDVKPTRRYSIWMIATPASSSATPACRSPD